MTNLLKIINLIYLIFITTSMSFFSYKFFNQAISQEVFLKNFVFFIGSVFLLFLSYKSSRSSFKSTIDKMGVDEGIAIPILMLVFLVGFSVALSITFIAFLEALGILFTVKSLESLALNILALISFFWLAFILFMGWDYIKIAGIASQYSMLDDIEAHKRSSFFKKMKIFFSKSTAIRDSFLSSVAIDMSCKSFSKKAGSYYKNFLLPVKVWSACLIICDNKNIEESLENSFSFFKSKAFDFFYASNFTSTFLTLMIVPIVLSLGIVISNFEYFSSPYCFSGDCFFAVVFFLIFISLGFFFSYSISISLESAHYVKILNNIKGGEVTENFKQVNKRIDFIEDETHNRISKLKGNFWDILRIYF